MSHYPSLNQDARLEELFSRFPRGVAPLIALHDQILRDDSSPLCLGDRELIAAFVSGLNACKFCFGAHKLMAKAFGVEEKIIDDLITDEQAAKISAKYKPLFAYLRKLTLSPAKITANDTKAVLAAGWSEEALYDASLICALFNFMNRVLDGAGIEPKPLFDNPSDEDLKTRSTSTYSEWAKAANLIK
ncbi:MAG: peroxidase-related enzyme [Robiginitomaculum sp.]|nr:peroxidase-related enzyme [Robiginitomaculum sp.]